MNYRTFSAAGIDVSLLGFGAMRLPMLDSDKTRVDEAEATRMIRHAIDNGVNYVDTAYMYHDYQGESIVGKALLDGYREKVLLATKLPFWLLDSPDEMPGLIDGQLEKLRTDCIDMYLMHDISGNRMETVREWRIWDLLEKYRSEGKIRFIGFSFHGETPAFFKEVLDEYPWDFCQIQLNYKDKYTQAGIEGYEYAASKGVPIVVMEPLKGGRIIDVIPPSIQQFWDSLDSSWSPAEWALRFVANLPGVLTILSGMSNMEQVEENLRVLSDADAGMMSAEELDILDKVAEEYEKLTVYPCTSCEYCLPCPSEIVIPQIIEFRNNYALFQTLDKLKLEWGFAVNHQPSECTGCGSCEEKCPQHLEIIQAMKETAELFE